MADQEPVRSCSSCRTRKSQKDLIRIRLSGSSWQIRPVGAAEGAGRGRSTYVCPVAACQAELFKKGRLARAFRISLSPSQLEELRLELSP